MMQRLISWWESRSGRDRLFIAYPIVTIGLFIFHLAFPLLTWGDRVLYSILEGIPVTLIVAWATQNELRRRAEIEARMNAAREQDDR